MTCVSARSVWCSIPAVRSRMSPRTWRAPRDVAAVGRQAEADAGTRRDRLTTEERERLKALEREVCEANEILKAASTFRQGPDGTPRR